MKYKFYIVSSEAWDAMLEAIKSAQKSIYWEGYILSNNTPTHNFFSLLKNKASQGVRVKMIADAFGSFWLSSNLVEELELAGVEILFFNHHWWWNRNHKKILIVDEQIGFIGGVNVAKRYANWMDLHVRLQGLVVRGLLRSFIKSYKICGGRDNINASPIKIIKKLRILDHWPWLKRSLRKYYVSRLNNAQGSIVIATPYFFPHGWLVKALKRASRRGVKIEIILPKKIDIPLITKANYIFASLVKEKNSEIEFYFTNEMIHAKSLLVDNLEGLIGSNNIHARSFDYNAESGLVTKRKDMLRDLKAILDNWKNNSKKFYFNAVKKNWRRRLIEKIFQALQPIL